MQRSSTHVLLCLAVALALFAIVSVAHAGSRPYYLHVVEIGAGTQPHASVASWSAFMSHLLGCDVRQPACLPSHTEGPGTSDAEQLHAAINRAGRDLDGEVMLHALPPEVTLEILDGVIHNRAAARRAYARALEESDLDGVLVVRFEPTVSHVYTIGRNGRVQSHVRYRPSESAPSQRTIDRALRAIIAHFNP